MYFIDYTDNLYLHNFSPLFIFKLLPCLLKTTVNDNHAFNFGKNISTCIYKFICEIKGNIGFRFYHCKTVCLVLLSY